MWGDAQSINGVAASPTAPTGAVVTGADTFVFAPANGNDDINDFRGNPRSHLDDILFSSKYCHGPSPSFHKPVIRQRPDEEGETGHGHERSRSRAAARPRSRADSLHGAVGKRAGYDQSCGVYHGRKRHRRGKDRRFAVRLDHARAGRVPSARGSHRPDHGTADGSPDPGAYRGGRRDA